MNKEESLAWSKLLLAQGEGRQLQRQDDEEETGWIDRVLERVNLQYDDPSCWRVKPKSVLKPWKLDPKYIGRVLKHTQVQGCFIMITGITVNEFTTGHMGAYTPIGLLRMYVQLDGSPCGEME